MMFFYVQWCSLMFYDVLRWSMIFYELRSFSSFFTMVAPIIITSTEGYRKRNPESKVGTAGRFQVTQKISTIDGFDYIDYIEHMLTINNFDNFDLMLMPQQSVTFRFWNFSVSKPFNILNSNTFSIGKFGIGKKYLKKLVTKKYRIQHWQLFFLPGFQHRGAAVQLDQV